MFALDLFNNDHERRLAEGAVDQLEQRRIDDLAMKMDDLVDRAHKADTPEAKAALVKEFQKCKDERDGYYKIKDECMGYGGLGETDQVPVGRMQPGTPEYAAARNRSVKYAELTPDYTGGHKTAGPTTVGYKKATNKPLVPGEVEVAEAGLPDVADKAAKMDRLNQPGKVGTDVVAPQQRVNPNPNKGVVGHAVDWLRGQGGPGKEGPTFESELDEQEGDSRVYAARLVFQQIIKAVQDNVDFATITWPDNSSQKLTRNQLWHLVQKARGMSRQARNQFALKVLPTPNDLMYYLGNLKKVEPRPQQKPPVDPNQPSLDLPKPLEELAQKKNSEDPDLDSKTARDATVQRELQKMRARQPNARSDIEALVKDELEQQEKTNQELEQLQSVNSQQDAELKKVLSLNTQQDQEITNLNQKLSSLDGKLNQALGKSTQPATTPATAKPTTVAPTTSTVSTPGEMPLTVDNKTDQEIAKLQSQIGQLETMMTLKAPSDPKAEERLQQQINKLEAQIEKLNNRPEVTPVALPTATIQTPVGSTPQLPNIEPTTLPAIEVPSVRAGSNDINVGNRRPSATADNDFDILDLGDFDDLVDEPATKKKKKKHSDTTVDRPAGTTPFTGGTKNNQWGPKNMPSGRFTVQDVDPYDIGVHEAVEPGEEMTTNELLYRAAVEFMQHMGREGRPIDYETAVKLAAKHYHIPYRPGMVPELHNKRAELDAKLDAAIRAKQAERNARKQRQLARTAPTTPEQEKKTQEYWATHAPQATRLKAPAKSLEEGQRLHAGDPIVVTAPNEFEGKTGEIYDFAPSGKFVIVNLYNHGKHSMHLSDVEYNQYANDQDEKEFWNGDKEVNESNMSELDAMRQDLELMNDRQFKVAYGISKVAFRQKYRALLNPAPQQDVPVEEGWQDFNKVEPYAVCLAGKPVKKFDYYEEARRFHDNWKKKLYREGNKAKADKITLMPLNLDEEEKKLGFGEFPPKQEITIVPPKKLKSGETYQDKNKYWQSQGQAPIYKTNEVKADPTGSWVVYGGSKVVKFKTHTGAKAYAEKAGGKVASSEFYADKIQKQGVAEATPRHFGPKGAGTELARQIRANGDTNWVNDLSKDQLNALAGPRYPKRPKIQVKKNKGVAEVAPPGAKAERMVKHIKKSLSKDGNLSDKDKAIAYATTWKAHNAGKVEEAQTDYQKRRQRERDVDAGRPVKPLPKNPQTDYARKRAKDRKDMELGEMHEPQKFIVTINGKATSPLYADMADRLYIAAKRAQPNARIEKTLAPTTERQKGIDRVKAGYGDEDALELHEQGLMKPPTNRKEYLDQRDKLFRMLAVDANPVNKQIIKQALKDLDDRYDSIKNPVNEENSTSSEAVEIALIRRVLVSHTELIMEFGLDKVTQAIEEVAYNVGDVDEIGSSDVSAWIHQVKQILGAE